MGSLIDMKTSFSKSANNRQNGKHQVNERRASILASAEKLFLQKGLEKTSMVEISRASGITKVTLYRYFADREPIANEIAEQMLNKIAESADLQVEGFSLENLKKLTHAMILNFHNLHDAYRFIGMFDLLYGGRYSNDSLAAWIEQKIFSRASKGTTSQQISGNFPHGKQFVMILSTVMSFLEKMASREKLLSMEQEVSVDDQLSLFSGMIDSFFDRLMETKP
jgi:AcrR family transcriptional regulator